MKKNQNWEHDSTLLLFQMIYTQKNPHKDEVASKHTLEKLTERVRLSGVSAVFLSMNMLTGSQLATLQQKWKVPVYDR